eukprot:TRINITY_DN12096_c0_g5_i4.p1 TRINITY_DN12096_c0_g5~~TRINITY_DN12096_c0_g5_i4.p1  ORF type:complete len:387 (+),score=99.47 TRINITY_DN12096_c0_g5_i4:76-1236(+)
MSSRKAGSSRRKRRNAPPSLQVRAKFTNNLPDVPFPPKFLPYTLELERLAEYKGTSLEKRYQFPIQAPADVGVPINLLDLEAFQPSKTGLITPLDPADQALMEDEVKGKTERHISTRESRFLIRPDYIGGEAKVFGRNPTSNDHKVVSANIVDKPKSPEEIVQAIADTFDKAQMEVPRHPTKPHLKVKTVQDILPDFDAWGTDFLFGSFAAEPLSKRVKEQDRNATKKMSYAVMQGQTSGKEEFIGYFLPNDDAVERFDQQAASGVEPQVGEEFQFEKAQEFNFEIIDRDGSYVGSGEEDLCFFVERATNDGYVFYNPFNRRIKLTQRRHLDKPSEHQILPVQHREPTEEERLAQEEACNNLKTTEELEAEAQEAMQMEDDGEPES